MNYTMQQRKRYAKGLKRNQTRAEKSLRWLYLFGFRPQVITPCNYVADWYHKYSRVIVELDGQPHTTKMGRASDKRRDNHHLKKGIITIRVRNESALGHRVITAVKILTISTIWQLWTWFSLS